MENSSTAINLYQNRSFDENLSAAFSFVRVHAKELGRNLLLVAGPFGLLYIAFSALFSSELFNASTGTFSFGSAALLGGLSNLFSAIFNLTIGLVVFLHLKYLQENQNAEAPSVAYLWQNLPRFILPLVGLAIVIGVGVVAGTFLLIIPGIYLFVKWSVALPSLVFANTSVGGALNRSWELTSENWWKCLGYLVVVGLISALIGVAIYLPYLIYGGAQAIFTVSQENAFNTAEGMNWFYVLNVVYSVVAGLVIYGISYSAIAFLYGSLSEEKESTALLSEIDKVGQKESESTQEGSY